MGTRHHPWPQRGRNSATGTSIRSLPHQTAENQESMLPNWRLDLSSPLVTWSYIGATESRLIRYYRRESTRSTRASCK
jgi:hypothetical protein